MDNASRNEQNPKIMQNKLEAESCKQAPLKWLVFIHLNLQGGFWKEIHTDTHTHGNKHHTIINNSIRKD